VRNILKYVYIFIKIVIILIEELRGKLSLSVYIIEIFSIEKLNFHNLFTIPNKLIDYADIFMFSLNIFSYLQISNIEVGILMDSLDTQKLRSKLRRDSV